MKIFFLLLFIISSCQDYNSNSSDRSKYSPIEFDPAELSTGFDKALPVLQSRCISCHFHENWASYKASQDWIDSGLVSPGDPENSLLIARIKNSGPGGDMPQNSGNLPDQEYKYLTDWVTNLP